MEDTQLWKSNRIRIWCNKKVKNYIFQFYVCIIGIKDIHKYEISICINYKLDQESENIIISGSMVNELQTHKLFKTGCILHI